MQVRGRACGVEVDLHADGPVATRSLTRTIGAVVACVLATVLLCVPVLPHADALTPPLSCSSADSRFGPGEVLTRGRACLPGSSSFGTPGATGAGSGQGTGRDQGPPAFRQEWVVACQGNSPGDPANTLCGLAATGCGPGQLLRWLFRTPLDAAGNATGPAVRVSSACLTDAEAAGAPAVTVVGLSLEQFRALPLPAGVVHVQPGTGYVLVNVPTNVYAQAAPAVLATTVAGIGVQVRATPATFVWAFGDGASLGPTVDAGAPYPALRLTHTYTIPTSAAITLTTTYSGEYSVAGGPWTPIAGTADVASTPVPITAIEARPAMVAQPLTGS